VERDAGPSQQFGTGEPSFHQLEREAVIARVELGLSHAEMAETLKKPSVDAARMSVARALAKLAQLVKTL
jgi:DNA-directed RNA polymerase specialized sigma24 family protein